MRRLLIPILAAAVLLASNATAGFAAEREDRLVARTLEGQEMIFARRYDAAARIFGEIARDWPDSPAGCFGRMAVLEIRMLEREDFHLEEEYKEAAKEGREKVGRLLQRYKPTTWDLFLAGSLLGLDGFFKARKGQWWDAYVAGNRSRQLFRRAKEMDPNFVDADFGLGMYIYWRSVFAKELSFLRPFISDRRAKGMAIVQRVAGQGRLAKDLARVNLGVMYMEENRFADAQRIFGDYVARYPDNVILRTMLGRTLIGAKAYGEAVAQFSEALKVEPSLKKPHYFIGVALTLAGDKARFPEAERELTAFLELEKGGRYWPSYAHYWLGRLAEAQGDVARAKAEYEEAAKLNSKIKDAVRRARGMGGGV